MTSAYIRRIILYGCCGVLGGTALATGIGHTLFDASLNINVLTLWQKGVIFVAVVGMALVFFRRVRMIGVVLLFVAIGIARVLLSVPVSTPDHLLWYADGTRHYYQGRVVGFPESRIKNQHIIVEVQSVGDGTEARHIQGRVLVIAPLYPPVPHGATLIFSCSLTRPEPFNGFAYDKYLARKRIYTQCFWPHIEEVSSSSARNGISAPLRYTYTLKAGFINILEKLYPEPQSSLLAGLLVGLKSTFTSEITTSFQRTGISHIVAISGYNITLVARIVFGILIAFGLWRKQAFYGVVAALAFFVLFTGAEASVIRAALMGVLVLLAQHNGRPYVMHVPLLLAATAMVIWSPLVLLYDPGFQLSYLATIGLIYLEPLVADRWSMLRKSRILSTYVVPTVIAMVATAPLIAVSFGSFSLVGIFANLLVLPVIPLVMLAGLITVLVGILFPSLGFVLAYPVSGILTYIISVAEVLSALSYAAVDLPYVSAWLGGVMYAAAILLFIWHKKRSRES